MADLMKDVEGAMGNQSGGGGGGGGLEQDAMKGMSGGGGGGGQSSGEDAVINQGVDKVLSSEGVPGIADGAINKEVDSEVGKFT